MYRETGHRNRQIEASPTLDCLINLIKPIRGQDEVDVLGIPKLLEPRKKNMHEETPRIIAAGPLADEIVHLITGGIERVGKAPQTTQVQPEKGANA